jgi:hypothetical protein
MDEIPAESAQTQKQLAQVRADGVPVLNTRWNS